MASFYHAFGLTFQSSRPLPWLPAGDPADRIDVRIEFDRPCLGPKPAPGESVRARLPGPLPSDPPQLTIWQSVSGGRFRYRYRDGTEFSITADGSRVRAAWPASGTMEDAAAYLLGPITGFVLRLRGRLCLHASAAAAGGGALALTGPTGSGKSSSAAVFARWGLAVLTDDILVIEENENGFFVLPGWPHLRLWPSSASMLFGQPDALPRLCPVHKDWNKCYMDLSAPPFRHQAEPLPLRVIFAAQTDGPGAPRIEPMSRIAALRTLLSNTYAWYALDGSMRAADLDCLARLVAAVPVRCLATGDPGKTDLERQCRAMLEDAGGTGPIRAAAVSGSS
jgi:hypothetical protein